MKIITDQNLIDYRIALQQQMYRTNTDMGILMNDLRNKTKRQIKINKDDLRIIRDQITLLSSMFYEMEFGGYFSQKDDGFQKKIMNRLTERYFKYIFDQSIDNIFPFTIVQTYADMEIELKKQIEAEKNGQ